LSTTQLEFWSLILFIFVYMIWRYRKICISHICWFRWREHFN